VRHGHLFSVRGYFDWRGDQRAATAIPTPLMGRGVVDAVTA
jgi:hypothetical protein